MDLKKTNKKNQQIINKIFMNYMPDSIRKFILKKINPIFWLYLKIYSIIYETETNMYLVHGKEKYSREKITVLLSSNNIASMNYLKNLIFYEEPVTKKIGKIKIKKISQIRKKYEEKVDLTISHTDSFYDRLFEKNNFIIIPRMLSQVLDISMPFDEVYKKFNKSLKERIKKTEEQNYYYEVAKDVGSFDFFYYKMYLPYAKKRFGEQAIIWDYDTVRSIFEVGRLLFIKHNDKRVLGLVINNTKKDWISLYVVGIIEGKEELLEKNIGIACNLFSILWAKEKGIKYIDFGLCRAFLNDGVFQHNRQWGMKIDNYKNRYFRGKYREIYCLKICRNNKAVSSFLINNPFVYVDKRKLCSMLFVENKNILTQKQIDKFKKKYLIPNISKLNIKTPIDHSDN